MILLGILSFTFCYLFVTFLNMSAENQVRISCSCTLSFVPNLRKPLINPQAFRVRQLFLRSLLRQEVAWYDVNNSVNFAAHMIE